MPYGYTENEAGDNLLGFKEYNPHSNVLKRSLPSFGKFPAEDILSIGNPWDDPTLIIRLPEDIDEFNALASILNTVALPKRYSAIIHKDSNLLEVIWTAYKRTPVAKEVEKRKFDFHFNGRSHSCRFDQSTDRLLTLAKHCIPISSPGPSEHRNIVSLHHYASDSSNPIFGDPVSFFVELHDLNDAELLDLVKNLNAYMVYYDRKTPRILTHEDVEGGSDTQRGRYIEDGFPQSIRARPLDSNVLSFWVEAASSSNPVMRYLLCHRILEYTAFNFVEAETRAKIRKIIAAPNVHDRIDKVAGDVAELVGIFKETHDIARMSNLVSATLDFERLWRYIDGQKKTFAKETRFEGGFCVKPIISDKEQFETWKPRAVSATLKALRDIRNALSHGQDGATRGTIQPTRQNQALLNPWVNVIEIVAGDSMLYKDVV